MSPLTARAHVVGKRPGLSPGRFLCGAESHLFRRYLSLLKDSLLIIL